MNSKDIYEQALKEANFIINKYGVDALKIDITTSPNQVYSALRKLVKLHFGFCHTPVKFKAYMQKFLAI